MNKIISTETDKIDYNYKKKFMSPIVFIWGISSFKRLSINYKDSSPLPPPKNP